MTEFFKWLFDNTKPRQLASFQLGWFAIYVLMTGVVIHEAFTDTPKALYGLLLVGLMVWHQILEFKASTKK